MSRSQDAVLTALDELAVDGLARCTLGELCAATGLGETAARGALRALEAADAIEVVTRSSGRSPNVYLVNPSEPLAPTLRQPLANPSAEPLANPSDPRAPTSDRGGSPPTPSLGGSGPRDPEGSTREPLASEPLASEGFGSQPLGIGQQAVRAAMDAAKAAGRSIEPALRARIGNAAQQLAKDESVERILAGARRLGEGGFADLYTAVRAVERGAPPPVAAPEPIASGSKLADVFRLVRATWPRAQIDVAVWEAELERIPAVYVLAAIREIARAGADFAPNWGQVYKAAYRIGVDETERRRSATERARLRGIVTAIEEGRA